MTQDSQMPEDTVDADEAVAILDAELERVERLVPMLERIESLITPSTGWTVRESLAHISVHYPEDEVAAQVARLERLARGGARSRSSDFDLDEANAERIAALAHLTNADIVNRIRAGRREIRMQMLTMDDEFLAIRLTGFGPDEPQTVGALLLESTALHDRLHLDEIDEAIRLAAAAPTGS